MKIIAAFVLVFLGLVNLPQTQARDTVLVLSDSWMQAMTENDLQTLGRFLTEDFYLILTGRRNARIPRTEWINNSKFYEHLGYENAHVITLNSTIKVVTAKENFNVSDEAWYQPSVKTWAPVVDIWVVEQGRWKVKRRIVGDWALFLWWDRGLGFFSGLVFAGLILFLRRLILQWRKNRRSARAEVES